MPTEGKRAGEERPPACVAHCLGGDAVGMVPAALSLLVGGVAGSGSVAEDLCLLQT